MNTSASCIFDNVFQRKKFPWLPLFNDDDKSHCTSHFPPTEQSKAELWWLWKKFIFFIILNASTFPLSLSLPSALIQIIKKYWIKSSPETATDNILMLSHDKINIWRRIRDSLKIASNWFCNHDFPVFVESNLARCFDHFSSAAHKKCPHANISSSSVLLVVRKKSNHDKTKNGTVEDENN